MMPFIYLARKQSSKQQDGEYTKVYCFRAGAGAALFFLLYRYRDLAVCYVSFFFFLFFFAVSFYELNLILTSNLLVGGSDLSSNKKSERIANEE
jgi:hypothetical protein